MEYRSSTHAIKESDLAAQILAIAPEIAAVTLAPSFITVSIDADCSSWDVELECGTPLGDQVENCIGNFIDTGMPVVNASVDAARNERAAQSKLDGEHPVVEEIREVLDTHVRANVQADGGDVELHSFDPDTGDVVLRLKGPCVSCASSTVTVQFMIKNVLQHYVPEVNDVSALDEGETDCSTEWTG